MLTCQFVHTIVKRVSTDGFPRASWALVHYQMSRTPELEPSPKSPSTNIMSAITSVEEPEIKIKPIPKLIPISDEKAVLDVNKQQDEMLKLALPFEEVPGPEVLKMVAKAWSYLPLIGTQITAGAMVYVIHMLGANLTWNRAASPFNHMFDRYGPVVRLQGPLGGDIVFISRPEHIETVYRQEGRYPVRSVLDSLELYRLQHRKLRISGPFNMSGPEWQALRSKLESPLQHCVTKYSNLIELACDELIHRIQDTLSRQEEVPKNFYSDIYKWSLECIGLVAFDKRLGCLDRHGLLPTTETSRLLEALIKATAALRKCESGFQMWRFIETPSWYKLITACDIIDSIVAKHIRVAQSNLRKRKDPNTKVVNAELTEEPLTLLETLLATDGLYPEDLLTVILDMLLIGVNSTAHAMSFVLYHLSQSVRIQRELFDEVLTIMPEKDSTLTYANIHKLRLLQACIKESLRLKPPIPVMTRVLPKDIALHSYRVPKGTYMLMTSHVAALREENFEDARKFKPDRWLTNGRDIHPFAAIPFGHGPRSCLGRSLAEIQLWMLTAKLIRNFRIEYHYGAINTKSRFIAMPDKPLKFRFIDRN